jgi:DnaJ like chaperone protein
MSDVAYEFHPGSQFPLPEADRWHPPTGQVTWVHAENAYVTSSGPSLALWVDFDVARAAGQQQIVVIRLQQRDRYVLSSLTTWQDAEANLAATLVVTMPDAGAISQLYLALPYAAFPTRFGGTVRVEVAVHDPGGDLNAIGHFPIELPADVDRVPDVLTVTTHALVAIARAVDGALDPDEEIEILALMIEHYGLDELGENAIRRILATAQTTFHSPQTLAEVLAGLIQPDDGARFVDLIYAAARADGEVQPPEQAFIDDLLALLGIYDHVRRGPEGFEDCWEHLEIAPTIDWPEIKAAYRQRVRDYHPDRVQNLAKGFHDYANRRMAGINDAYSRLKDALSDAPDELDEADGAEEPTDPGARRDEP